MAEPAGYRAGVTHARRIKARFWYVVHAWEIGQITDLEFVREQRSILGFVWITPRAAADA